MTKPQSDPLVAPVVGGTPDGPHPWYGPCDGFGVEGECSVCYDMAEERTMNDKPLDPAPEFDDWASHIADEKRLQTNSPSQIEWEIVEALNKAYRLGQDAALVPRPEPREPEIEELRRTVNSIAMMLGWMNVPPRDVLERDIAALKALAAAVRPASAPSSRYPIRAHVEGCPKALRVPVDLCDCGGRDVTSDPSASAPSLEPEDDAVRRQRETIERLNLIAPSASKKQKVICLCDPERSVVCRYHYDLQTAASAPSRPLEDELRLGHLALDETRAVETKGQPIERRIVWMINLLSHEKSELQHNLLATGCELDAMRSQMNAAEHRRAAAEYRASRIVLDAELKERAEKAEAEIKRLRVLVPGGDPQEP